MVSRLDSKGATECTSTYFDFTSIVSFSISVLFSQKTHVNLVDIVKSFPTNIWLQNLASIQKRTSPIKFAHLAENQRMVRYRTFQLRQFPEGVALVDAVAEAEDVRRLVRLDELLEDGELGVAQLAYVVRRRIAGGSRVDLGGE